MDSRKRYQPIVDGSVNSNKVTDISDVNGTRRKETSVRTAIISVSTKGAQLGQRVKALVAPHGECYEKTGRQSGGEAVYFDSLKSHIERIMRDYDQVLFIMAMGIVVRMIAPYIEHKSKDPAIVVIDEAGQHTISLLSGHLGGANEWTRTIALAIDSDPVITTATDVNGLPAPDVWARKEGLVVDDFQTLIAINAAIVAGEIVPYYIDESLPHGERLVASAKEHLGQHSEVYTFNAMTSSEIDTHADRSINRHRKNAINSDSFRVVVTDKMITTTPNQLILRPKTFAMGIGCRRDTPKNLILDAIQQSLEKQKLSPKSLLTAASVVVKADEIGLLTAVQELGWPIVFFEQDELATVIEEYNLTESTFVKRTIGVGNVCETTALLAAKSHTLIQEKTVYPKTTIAIAQVTLK